jgi:hypothetical protein
MDERNSNLMPPSPAGTGAGDSAVSGSSAAAGVSFIIKVEIE